MFLTKECDYAIRIVRALSDFEKKTAKMICDSEHIPFNFAYKILKKLEKVDMVFSVQGSNGGYQLAKRLNQISVFDIISAVNENIYIYECLKPGHICPSNSEKRRCNVHQEFVHIQDDLMNRFRSKTIDMLL